MSQEFKALHASIAQSVLESALDHGFTPAFFSRLMDVIMASELLSDDRKIDRLQFVFENIKKMFPTFDRVRSVPVETATSFAKMNF